jgi:hypothetical protein
MQSNPRADIIAPESRQWEEKFAEFAGLRSFFQVEAFGMHQKWCSPGGFLAEKPILMRVRRPLVAGNDG